MVVGVREFEVAQTYLETALSFEALASEDLIVINFLYFFEVFEG